MRTQTNILGKMTAIDLAQVRGTTRNTMTISAIQAASERSLTEHWDNEEPKSNLPRHRPPSHRPFVIGFGSAPGGTGCTMLAMHAAVYAARQGMRTLAVSVDPTGGLMFRLGASKYHDAAERCDSAYEHLQLFWSQPGLLIRELVRDFLPHTDCDVIVIDLGPNIVKTGLSSVPLADCWVIPVPDERALRSLASRLYPVGTQETLFVRTFCPDAPSLDDMEAVFDKFPPAGPHALLHTDIPSSGLLRRTCNERKTIWELGPQSASCRRIDSFCSELFGRTQRFESQ